MRRLPRAVRHAQHRALQGPTQIELLRGLAVRLRPWTISRLPGQSSTTPTRHYVGSSGDPAFEPRRAVPWAMYAFDPKENPKVGRRSREWTATGPTEARVVREMARCLREFAAGRTPR